MKLLQPPMRRTISATADKCLPPAEKRCKEMKANMPKSESVSSADGIAARRTLTSARRESAKAKLPSRCWARSEASDPPRVYTSTVPWCVIYGVNPPSVQDGSKEGFHSVTFFKNSRRRFDALKCALPPNIR